MIIYQEIYHIDFVTKLQSCRYYQDMIKNDNIWNMIKTFVFEFLKNWWIHWLVSNTSAQNKKHYYKTIKFHAYLITFIRINMWQVEKPRYQDCLTIFFLFFGKNSSVMNNSNERLFKFWERRRLFRSLFQKLLSIVMTF